MNFIIKLQETVAASISELYQADVDLQTVQVKPTQSEFSGDFTVVVFPFVKAARKSPDQVGDELGKVLQARMDEIAGFNVIKGF